MPLGYPAFVCNAPHEKKVGMGGCEQRVLRGNG